MREVRFVKMHGAANDFVLIDDRDCGFPAADRRLLAALGTPRTGIACEGIILVRPSETADFRMVFFNPDGSEADLCGNGARCVAAFAKEIGAAKDALMAFETRAGMVYAEVLNAERVKVWMPEPKDRRFGIDVDGTAGDFIVAGVPHFVVGCDDVAKVDVDGLGRRLRNAEAFAPAGTNVDFAQFVSPNQVFLRTYERGVEAESGACGTGSVAAAVVAAETRGLSLPIDVHTSQGFVLTIGEDSRPDGNYGFTLTGPVRRVFEGTVDLDQLSI